MKLQTLFAAVALALTAQAASNSTTAPSTERRALAFAKHPRSWLNETSQEIPGLNKRNETSSGISSINKRNETSHGISSINKRNTTVPRSIHVSNGTLHQ